MFQSKYKLFKNKNKNSIIGFMMLAPFFFFGSILEAFFAGFTHWILFVCDFNCCLEPQ